MKKRMKKKVPIPERPRRPLPVSSRLVASVVDNLQTRSKQTAQDRLAEQRAKAKQGRTS